MKKFAIFLGIFALLILIWLVFNLSKVSPISQITPIPLISPTPVAFTYAKVIRVFDGDTIEIEGGQKVRYIGMDTTEVYPKVQCYSEEAKKENEKLVLGQTVGLEKDISDTDKYGRLLRYIHLRGVIINELLVKSGYAKIETVPPDVKYQKVLLESEKFARENGLGLWSKCAK